MRQFFIDYGQEKIRVLLTMLAVMVATTVICLMISIGEGLRLSFLTRTTEAGVGLIKLSDLRVENTSKGKHKERISLTFKDYEDVKNTFSRYADFSLQTKVTGRFQYDTESWQGELNGVEPDSAFLRNLIAAPGGRFISERDNLAVRRVVFLGEKVAEILLGSSDDAVGKTVLLNHEQFVVIGVLKRSNQFVAIDGEPDVYQAWVPLTTLKTLHHLNTISAIYLRAKEGVNVEALLNNIKHFLAERYDVSPAQEQLLDYYSADDIVEKTNLFLLSFEVMLGLIGGITVVLAGVGIANVTYLSIVDNKQLIGMRMAVGAKPGYILRYYIFEALLTTLLGGGLGMLLALGLNELMASLIKSQSVLVDILGEFSPVFSPTIAALVICILLLIALFSGVLPARKGAHLLPAEALR